MKRLFPLLFLAGLLSSCTLTMRPQVGVNLAFGVDLTPTIVRLEPDRGQGATYFVNEYVRFNLSLNRPGYVTLVAIDPDGDAYEFSRYYLQAGYHVLSGPQGRSDLGFQLKPPRGVQRVRAIFTDAQYPSGVRFEGRFRDNGWDRQTTLYFQSSGARIRDVAETYFQIR